MWYRDFEPVNLHLEELRKEGLRESYLRRALAEAEENEPREKRNSNRGLVTKFFTLLPRLVRLQKSSM